MAAESEVPEKMMREHVSGYAGFLSMMKWGAIVSFFAAIIVIFLIS